MKKILISSTILFAMISCGEQPDTNIYHEVERTNDVYKVNVISTSNDPISLRVVIIDSCEYLIGRNTFGSNVGYGYLTHKGNCKYCAERRKRELQNLK